MNTTHRILSLVASTCVAAGALVFAGTGVASAAPDLGTLTITPVTGTTSSLLSARTAPGEACPSDSTGILIHLTGPGISSANDLLQGNTDMSLVGGPNGNISTPVSNTFRDVFEANTITAPNGDYTVRLACIGPDFFTETGEFEQVVTFTHGAGQANFVSNYATVVENVNTSTVITGPAASTFGDSVTLTATVSPTPSGGTVTFKEGATTLGTGPVNGSGVATYTASNFSVGANNITAEYSGVAGAAGAAGYNASTSSAFTHTVSKVSTTTALTSNGPTDQYSPATFTATVTPAMPGTVTFKENLVGGGTSTLGTGSVDGSGVATFTSASLSAGTHSVVADYAPAAPANVNGSSSTAVDHVVTAFAGVTASQPITVNVPTGALTISIAGTVGGVVPPVVMTEAAFQPDGQWYHSTGELNDVTITDTRAGDDGWTATGVASPFVNGASTVSPFNFGWTPALVTKAANQDSLHVGDPVAGDKVVSGGTATGTLGLGTAREFATTFDDHGNGAAVLDGSVELWIPTDVDAGTFAGTLTFTVI